MSVYVAPQKTNQVFFFKSIVRTKTSVVVNETFEILLKFKVSGSNAIDNLLACVLLCYITSCM